MAKFRIREIGTCWLEVEVEADSWEDAMDRYNNNEYSELFERADFNYGDDFFVEVDNMETNKTVSFSF